MNSLPNSLRSAWRRRALIYQMTRRDIATGFRGAVFSWLWLVLSPLLLLLIYWLIFAHIFGVPEHLSGGRTISYPLLIFSGLMVFQIFAECLQRGPAVLRENPNFIKRLVFPVELLAIVLLAGALFRASISLVILLAFYALTEGVPPASGLLLPIVWLPLAMLLLGAIWLLSAIGLFLRDIQNLLASVMVILMLASPVFYPVEQVPEAFRALYLGNPIAAHIDMARDLLLNGELPSAALYFGHFGYAAFAMWFGHRVFFWLRPRFADVV